MSAFRRRKPRTVAELRVRGDDRSFAVRRRGYLPTERDDLYTRSQRSWKKHRRTQYRCAAGLRSEGG